MIRGIHKYVSEDLESLIDVNVCWESYGSYMRVGVVCMKMDIGTVWWYDVYVMRETKWVYFHE